MRILSIILGGLAALFWFVPFAFAEDEVFVPDLGIHARVISVYDGDTLTVMAEPWPDFMVETRVRLAGVDTPEIHGDCEEENELATVARDRLAALAGEEVYLQNVKVGRFARRVVARVYTAEGVDIAGVLIEEGLGRVWNGRREGWCGNNRG